MYSVVTGMKDGQKVFFSTEDGFIDTVKQSSLMGSVDADVMVRHLLLPACSSSIEGVSDIKVELHHG